MIMITISYEVMQIIMIGAVIIFGLAMFFLGCEVTETKLKKQAKKEFKELLKEIEVERN